MMMINMGGRGGVERKRGKRKGRTRRDWERGEEVGTWVCGLQGVGEGEGGGGSGTRLALVDLSDGILRAKGSDV